MEERLTQEVDMHHGGFSDMDPEEILDEMDDGPFGFANADGVAVYESAWGEEWPTPVLCELDKGDMVAIDLSHSTLGLYAVSTEFGVEGFCPRYLIEV